MQCSNGILLMSAGTIMADFLDVNVDSWCSQLFVRGKEGQEEVTFFFFFLVIEVGSTDDVHCIG